MLACNLDNVLYCPKILFLGLTKLIRILAFLAAKKYNIKSKIIVINLYEN